MSGNHARPTTALFRAAPAPGPQAPPHAARHGRREGFGRRLHRRVLAYRDIELLPTHTSVEPGPGQECLLLVHVRKVVGQIDYRLCATCAEGVITGVDIDAHFLSSGLPNRALSHLRSRYPGTTWRSTVTLRTTRDMLRRMRIPTIPTDSGCAHARAVLQPTG